MEILELKQLELHGNLPQTLGKLSPALGLSFSSVNGGEPT